MYRITFSCENVDIYATVYIHHKHFIVKNGDIEDKQVDFEALNHDVAVTPWTNLYLFYINIVGVKK